MKRGFFGRLKGSLAADFTRMAVTPLFYIMAGVSFLIPVLVLVMTSFIGGEEGFSDVWQTIGSSGGAMEMNLTGMCNLNLVYFLMAVFVGLFVSADFSGGYCKNLFSSRTGKAEYVASKLVVCSVCGVGMILCYFAGAMLGGAVARLPFSAGGAGVSGIVCCLLSKCFLTAVFVAVDLLVSLFARKRSWLSVLGSLAAGMLLFPTVSIAAPLGAGVANVFMSLFGGALFAAGSGIAGSFLLAKLDLA